MEQIAIALTGATAVWLSQDKRETWRKWACIFGLCGQPFWFYSAYASEQWGIFALCFLYTYSWIRGFVNNWLCAKEERMQYQYREIGETDWAECSFDCYQYFQQSPIHDTRISRT